MYCCCQYEVGNSDWQFYFGQCFIKCWVNVGVNQYLFEDVVSFDYQQNNFGWLQCVVVNFYYLVFCYFLMYCQIVNCYQVGYQDCGEWVVDKFELFVGSGIYWYKVCGDGFQVNQYQWQQDQCQVEVEGGYFVFVEMWFCDVVRNM